MREIIEIDFREVNSSDMMLLYEWANDPITRAMSFNTTIISKTEHEKWFEKSLHSKNLYLFIIEINELNLPVGLIRIDEEGLLGISIDKQFRGLGLGSEILKKFIKYIKINNYIPKIEKIIALIKSENKASIVSFERAGFVEKGYSYFKGQACLNYHYSLR
ncbi:GNAT family N-acetyltransferase [Paenibacillus sp. ClWae2A]|uniref:GNAT family N-acetyltransferase n=1 Tax=Paenibacillus sp. ClWae2A TaxID=3057177 RepID=UPI0028F5F351|nr:GNAT family N-acetyltransferase [Paenibacillus sp. ClWae2A]MDT9720521.1 GNAT family N-acetyltransferase [Paenibacillus sp. ClWae2A]